MELESRTVHITSLAAGGDGLGRMEDGRVVFVEGGVPGDVVELADLQFGKRMARARIARLIEPSTRRCEPRCRHFGECGGCAWQHVEYSAQLEAKRGIVRDALERIGGLKLDAAVEIVASPEAYGYRARARLVEVPGGVGYRKRGSHEARAIDECPILVPAAQRKLHEIVERCRTEATSADRATNRERSGSRSRSARVEWEILAGGPEQVEARRVAGRPASSKAIEFEILGEAMRASVGSFVQGNALLWEALANEVQAQCLSTAVEERHTAGSTAAEPRVFVELFAGIGFLTLPLLRAGCRGVVFEANRAALSDLTRNLEKSGLRDRVEIVPGRIERVRDWTKRLTDADFLLLDPPRTGMDSGLRSAIAQQGPARVVYVSCDPATLARDLRALSEGGYRVAHVRALDLFPQTPHVEVVVRLERGRSSIFD